MTWSNQTCQYLILRKSGYGNGRVTVCPFLLSHNVVLDTLPGTSTDSGRDDLVLVCCWGSSSTSFPHVRWGVPRQCSQPKIKFRIELIHSKFTLWTIKCRYEIMKKIVILAENLVRSGNSRDLLDWSKTLENLENSLEILYSFKLKPKTVKN